MSPADIENLSRGLITATTSTLGVEVTTPIVYPNGECSRVFVFAENDYYIVHDAGLAEWYLTNESVRIDRLRFPQAAKRYNCEYAKGRVQARSSSEELGITIMLVANASRAVADFATEARRHSESQFRFVLTERVREIFGARLRENESFKGTSGTTYRVPNVILNAAGSDPLCFVMPLASRSAVASQFKELFDLKSAHPAVIADSVYDEDSDFRVEEDGWVLRQVGEVTPFGEIGSRLPALVVQ